LGKTTLAQLSPNPDTIDLDHETDGLQVKRRYTPKTFEELRAQCQADLPGQTILIDNLTACSTLIDQFVVRTIRNDKGNAVANLEAFGWGKGYRHVYDQWLLLLADLDRQVEKGKHVVLIAHEQIETFKNPQGEDFIRYAPLLQSNKQGDVRSRVVGWCSDVFYMAYDIAAVEGKGIGAGTRTIYGTQQPALIAKSRPNRKPQAWNDPQDDSFWKELLK
jgi:hypothetical protein